MWRPNISNRAFDRMGERYSRLIDPYHFLGKSSFDIPWKSENLPAANIRVEDEIFHLELMVPGFKKEEITITLCDGILTVKGEKKEKEAKKSEGYILEEFRLDAFERCFRLDPSIAKEMITADYTDGLLTLTFIDVPKEEEKDRREVLVA